MLELLALLVLDVSVGAQFPVPWGEPLTLRAGFDEVWMRALSQFGWRGLLPLNERVEFADDSGQDEENKVNPGR